MIASGTVAKCVHIVDQSEMVAILTRGMRPDPRGRKGRVGTNLRLLCIGLMLSATQGSVRIEDAYQILTQHLDLHDQQQLGVRDPDGHLTIRIGDFYYLSKRLAAALAYHPGSAPDLDDHERRRRHQAVLDACNAVMDQFDLGWHSTEYAIDATGIHAWARRPGHAPTAEAIRAAQDPDTDDDDPNNDGDRQADSDVTPGSTTTGETAEPARRASLDPDAHWGIKTNKDGKDEMFFGFHEHTLVQVPGNGQAADDEPRLVRRFEVRPANEDVVGVSFRLLDSLPQTPTTVIGDKHYHYKRPVRWQDELVRRGIRQCLDLRVDELGFSLYKGMLFAGGHPHCPATPPALGDLNRAPLNATKEQVIKSHKEFARRKNYALRVINQLDSDGAIRVECPAINGSVGCPLRPGTETAAITLGLPIVTPPDPAEAPLPTCCTQRTVKVQLPNPIRKLNQPLYWGSEPWHREWNKRTYVEGSYGNRKNPSCEDLRRGSWRIFGLTWANLAMIFVNASYNLRILENWAQRQRKTLPDHPLLTPVTQPTGYIAVHPGHYTLDQAA